jgi:hypothetical protein
MKIKNCDSTKCPLPMCNLPKVLTASQITLAIEYLHLVNKQIASDLHISNSKLYSMLGDYYKKPESLIPLSNYIRKRLIESL